jgi:hypothetical protein
MKKNNQIRDLVCALSIVAAMIFVTNGWSAEGKAGKFKGQPVTQAANVGQLGPVGPVQMIPMFSIVKCTAPGYYSGGDPRVIVRVHNTGGTGVATVTVSGSHQECVKYKPVPPPYIPTECIQSKTVQDGVWSAKSASLSKGQEADVTVTCTNWLGGKGIVTVGPSLFNQSVTVAVPGPQPK